MGRARNRLACVGRRTYCGNGSYDAERKVMDNRKPGLRDLGHEDFPARGLQDMACNNAEIFIVAKLE